jgi:hypothetical protein
MSTSNYEDDLQMQRLADRGLVVSVRVLAATGRAGLIISRQLNPSAAVSTMDLDKTQLYAAELDKHHGNSNAPLRALPCIYYIHFLVIASLHPLASRQPVGSGARMDAAKPSSRHAPPAFLLASRQA